MKCMVTFSFPTDSGNALVSSGKIKEVFGHLMTDLKPEAAYFYPVAGQRGGHFIINMNDSSDVVTVADRFWIGLGADVEITPVMSPEDLGKGLSHMPEIVQEFK